LLESDLLEHTSISGNCKAKEANCERGIGFARLASLLEHGLDFTTQAFLVTSLFFFGVHDDRFTDQTVGGQNPENLKSG